MRTIDPTDASFLALVAGHRVGLRTDKKLLRTVLRDIKDEWCRKVARALVSGRKSKSRTVNDAVKSLIAWDTANRTVHAPPRRHP